MRDDKFYIRRIECWGSGELWAVCDHDTRQRVSREFKTRAGAEAQQKRMTADWDKYSRHSWGKGGFGERRA